MEIFKGKMSFHYSCSFYSGPEDILLCWDVTSLRYPVQVIQIAVSIK